LLVLTNRLMPDVLRSNTTVSGELCVVIPLTTTMHKSHASCSDLGEFHLCFILSKVRPRLKCSSSLRARNSNMIDLVEECSRRLDRSRRRSHVFLIYTVRQKKLHRFIFAIALSELHLL